MEDDWDLQAVVRGCGTTTSSATATASSAASITNTSSCGQLIGCNNSHQDRSFSAAYCQDLFEPRRDNLIEELHDLYKPVFPKLKQPAATLQVGGSLVLSPQSLPISPLSVLGGFQDPSSDHQQQQQQIIAQQTQLRQKQQSLSVASGSKHSVSSHNPSPRSSKRRKNNLKKVCHVPAESLSSDMWSWRKYGQKPIKGSPYPRGYYKCSTSKGCLARKQVERNRSDPGMFILTYTAEHNHPMPTHRNSLAGCTRQKPPTTSPNSDDPNKPSCSPETSPPASLSQTPEKLESSREDLIEAEDDDLSVSNMALDDDFFEGLEDFASPDAGECINIHFPASMQIPCLANKTTTTAGGGG